MIYDGYSYDQETEFEVAVDCADQRVLGPMMDLAMTTRRIWFPEDALVNIVVKKKGAQEGLSGVYMTQECAPCSSSPQIHVDLGWSLPSSFRAGMHVFSFDAPLDAEAPLIVNMTEFYPKNERLKRPTLLRAGSDPSEHGQAC